MSVLASRFVAEPLRPEDIHVVRMLADPAVSPVGNLVAVTVLTQDPTPTSSAARSGSSPLMDLHRRDS